MDSKTKKLALIGAAVVAVGAGVTLALQAFNENLVFFFSPTQVAAKEARRPHVQARRRGRARRCQAPAEGVTVTFGITDTAKIVPVQYKGILPDLFAEGQGVVAQGKLDEQGVFCASEVLAKHDENYMPPEAAKALEDAHKAGVAKKQAEQAQAAKS
ncbi:MAG: cytochrome c maturation protein CcmE [Sutterella wadsworthensis]